MYHSKEISIVRKISKQRVGEYREFSLIFLYLKIINYPNFQSMDLQCYKDGSSVVSTLYSVHGTSQCQDTTGM